MSATNSAGGSGPSADGPAKETPALGVIGTNVGLGTVIGLTATYAAFGPLGLAVAGGVAVGGVAVRQAVKHRVASRAMRAAGAGLAGKAARATGRAPKGMASLAGKGAGKGGLGSKAARSALGAAKRGAKAGKGLGGGGRKSAHGSRKALGGKGKSPGRGSKTAGLKASPSRGAQGKGLLSSGKAALGKKAKGKGSGKKKASPDTSTRGAQWLNPRKSGSKPSSSGFTSRSAARSPKRSSTRGAQWLNPRSKPTPKVARTSRHPLMRKTFRASTSWMAGLCRSLHKWWKRRRQQPVHPGPEQRKQSPQQPRTRKEYKQQQEPGYVHEGGEYTFPPKPSPTPVQTVKVSSERIHPEPPAQLPAAYARPARAIPTQHTQPEEHVMSVGSAVEATEALQTWFESIKPKSLREMDAVWDGLEEIYQVLEEGTKGIPDQASEDFPLDNDSIEFFEELSSSQGGTKESILEAQEAFDETFRPDRDRIEGDSRNTALDISSNQE